MIEEEPVRKRRVHEVGQDLSALSVDELGHRIGELRGEIARLEAEIRSKDATRSAADAMFRR